MKAQQGHIFFSQNCFCTLSILPSYSNLLFCQINSKLVIQTNIIWIKVFLFWFLFFLQGEHRPSDLQSRCVCWSKQKDFSFVVMEERLHPLCLLTRVHIDFLYRVTETSVTVGPCADGLQRNLILINTAMGPCQSNMLIKLWQSLCHTTNTWQTLHLHPGASPHHITHLIGLKGPAPLNPLSGERGWGAEALICQSGRIKWMELVTVTNLSSWKPRV